MFKNYSILLLIVLFAAACSHNQRPLNRQVVAQAAGKTLHISDVQKDFENRNSENLDSVEFFNSYIERWIKQQLLLQMIEKEYKPSELDVKKELENYRQELIIEKYREKKLTQIVTETITDREILNYFNQNQTKFILGYPIVKVHYIIFKKGVSVPLKLKNKFSDRNILESPDLEDFIFQNAKKVDNFNNNWVYLDNLIQNANHKTVDLNKYLEKNNYFEFTVNGEVHFIGIKEYITAGKLAPYEFVAPQIRSMILNKKKLDFLREIKDSLYKDGLKYNKFSVFNK